MLEVSSLMSYHAQQAHASEHQKNTDGADYLEWTLDTIEDVRQNACTQAKPVVHFYSNGFI